MEESAKLKNIIFNETKYPKTKKIAVLIFIISLFLFQVSGADEMIGLAIVFTTTIMFIIYYGSKLLFYNTERNTKDIVYLTLFFGLLVWGLITFLNL